MKIMQPSTFLPAVVASLGLLLTSHSGAEDEESPNQDDLAKKLANPVSSLVSVPFQNNFDFGMGPRGTGSQWKLNIQPVIPTELNDDWNLITRVIVPVVHQEDIAGTPLAPSGKQTGLSDITASFFFSPAEPVNDWIMGVGPAFLLPSGTDQLLSTEKWGAGPTAVALKQSGPWTYGALVNHIWSFAGDDARAEVNSTFLQPFVAYVTSDAVTYSLLAESTYNWDSSQWTVPLNLAVSKLITVGEQKMQPQVGVRWYPEGPTGGPEWGVRASVILLFPK